MGVDILGALKRMVTLPKAHDRLETMFSPSVASSIHTVMHDAITDAATAALAALSGPVLRETGTIQAAVTAEVTKALHAQPDLAVLVNMAVGEAVGQLKTVETGAISGLVTNITAAVGKAMGISV